MVTTSGKVVTSLAKNLLTNSASVQTLESYIGFDPAFMDRLKLVKQLNCEDFTEFLEVEGAHEDVVAAFSNNRINGEAFVNLSEEDLKELVPIVGDRVFVRELLRKAREATATVCFFL